MNKTVVHQPHRNTFNSTASRSVRCCVFHFSYITFDAVVCGITQNQYLVNRRTRANRYTRHLYYFKFSLVLSTGGIIHKTDLVIHPT